MIYVVTRNDVTHVVYTNLMAPLPPPIYGWLNFLMFFVKLMFKCGVKIDEFEIVVE